MANPMVLIEEAELVKLIETAVNKCLNDKFTAISNLVNDISSTKGNDNKTILTFDEVCEMLRVKETTLFNLIKQNKIKSYKNGGKRQFLIDDVKSYIQDVKNTSNNEVSKWN